MFSDKDKKQFAEKGLEITVIEKQLRSFTKGFPYLYIYKPAIPNDGIITLKEPGIKKYIRSFETADNLSIVKFVPASGAASRMFKSLYECYLGLKKNPKDVEACLEEDEFASYDVQSRRAYDPSIVGEELGNHYVVQHANGRMLDNL